MMIGYAIYDRFTVERFPLRQNMILTISFFCLRQYNTTLLRILPASGKLGFISPAKSLT
jgi:hypothetical protein